MIGTSGLTISTTNAPRINLADDAGIVIHLGRRGGAYRNAGCVMMAMHAWPRKIRDLRMRERFAIGYFKKLHPGDAALLVRFIRPDRDIVFGRARHHARSASGAFVNIDDHTIFMLALFDFHLLPRKERNSLRSASFTGLHFIQLYKCAPPVHLTAYGVVARNDNFVGIDPLILLELIISPVTQAQWEVDNSRHGALKEVDTDFQLSFG